jgi:hypothetical protein
MTADRRMIVGIDDIRSVTFQCSSCKLELQFPLIHCAKSPDNVSVAMPVYNGQATPPAIVAAVSESRLSPKCCWTHLRDSFPQPASTVKVSLPDSGFVSDVSTISGFIESVRENKMFVPRSKAEQNANYLQPIPCAILRYDKKF